MTELQIGAIVAKKVWLFLHTDNLELVPWQKDPIKIAKLEARKEAFQEVIQFMKDLSHELKERYD